MNDEVHIPSRYAVRQAMRDIHEAARRDASRWGWLAASAPELSKRRHDVERTVERIREGPGAACIASHRRIDTRRLGKPEVHLRIGRVVADRFITHDGERWGLEQDVLVMRRDDVRLRRDHLEERSTPSGLIVTRHAVERFYDRGGCNHLDIRHRLLDDLADAERAMALAVSAGLFAFGGRFEPGAQTIIPFGSGLLLARNVVVAIRRGSKPSTRYTVERRGVVSNPVSPHPQRSRSIDPLAGIEVEGHVLSLGMTFVSDDLLHLEQLGYLAAFRREMDRHDLNGLSEALGSVWMPHEKPARHPDVEVDPRLRYLLSQISTKQPQGRVALSIGWERTSDPRLPKDLPVEQEA